jgi:hypothetical protein
MVGKQKNLVADAQDGAPQIPMTPMIDIVFQLLIFFMLACRFRTREGRIENLLPRYGLNTTPVTSPIPMPVRVKLLWCEPDGGRETLNPVRGRAVLKVGQRVLPDGAGEFGKREPEWNALYNLLRGAAGNWRPTRAHRTLPVIIDARGLVPFKHVISALNECIRVGLTDITFAAPELSY